MSGKKKPDAISQEDWDAVDSPELTDDQLAAMRPVGDVLPDVVDAYRKTRGKQKAPTKQQVTLRLDQDVVQHFKQDGAGWQTRINAALRAMITVDEKR
ncbi:BrnA antitoxin family protein [Pyruvatibacter mobilis]|uniref:BrnA antitoxin family protein n=1 Tax=Pyruvatibacter mobilis TaxID=1712261 RepID=UPI003BAEAB26